MQVSPAMPKMKVLVVFLDLPANVVGWNICVYSLIFLLLLFFQICTHGFCTVPL